MITVAQMAYHALRVSTALRNVEQHAAKFEDPQLTRALDILHAHLGHAVIAAETTMKVASGTIHPLGGGDKPPAAA